MLFSRRPAGFTYPLAGGIALLLTLAACSPPRSGQPVSADSPASTSLRYTAIPIGFPAGDKPWVAHVAATDLDQDGTADFVICEAKDNTVSWIRRLSNGEFEEAVLAAEIKAPVHSHATDIDGDGDLDLLIACMSYIFPNNDQIGSIVALENQGGLRFRKRILLENTSRVSDVKSADFDGDGRMDLAVGQFGYDQGEIRWMRQTGPWIFASEILLRLSGAINVCVADFNQDGHTDLAAQVSQQWEEIHLFLNDGKGDFRGQVIWGSTNEDYASSGMSVCDLNKDGRPDLLFSNGDGFGPTPIPGPRPWHGVQWLENLGPEGFRYHRIADLPGAYSPRAADLDGDGDLDVVAVSNFNDWSRTDSDSLVWFENQGNRRFAPHTIAREPIQLLTLAVGEFDPTEGMEIVTGGFHSYEPYERMSRVMLWKASP